MTLLNKINLLLLIIAMLFFSSCATILNSPVQKISISTDSHIKVISMGKVAFVDSTWSGIDAPRDYYVGRSSKPLKVTLKVDSIQKTISLKPRNSFAYWFNIYANYGIGMLVDKENTKRYGYPTRNYLTVKDTSIKIFRFAPVKRGTMNLSFSLPFTTIFDIKAIDKPYKSAGILGLEAGMDYFYRDNEYLSISIGAATDRFGEYFGKGYLETGTSLYSSIRNNNMVGSFDLGYGINLSQLKWTKQTIGDTIKLDQSVNSRGVGPSLSAQYRLGNYFRLGILYQPNVLNTSVKPIFYYQHYISLNLTWKLPVKKPSR